MKKEKTDLKKSLSRAEKERLEILQKADELKDEQLFVDMDSELQIENLGEKLLSQNIDDPVKKYQLYYNGLLKLLKDHLPKGKENKEARQLIYDEKNILLNRGAKKDEKGIRGSDSRMAYIEDIEIAIQIVADWVVEKGSAMDLYQAFWDKNEELGYDHQD